jgi:hypothetical protein
MVVLARAQELRRDVRFQATSSPLAWPAASSSRSWPGELAPAAEQARSGLPTLCALASVLLLECAWFGLLLLLLLRATSLA